MLEIPAPSAAVVPIEKGWKNLIEFSVIIPAYQAGATIRRAVESALTQTLPPHEIIVCDDGSTDSTAEILTSYDDRVRVITQSNHGLSAARNAAGRASTGDWVVLLDADDEWLPTRLERLAEAIDGDPDVDIVTTDAIVRTPGRPDTRFYATNRFPNKEEQAEAILDWGSIFAGAAIRRSVLEENDWFTVGLPHDSEWEAWVRLLWAGSRAALVDEPLAIYHNHDGPRLSDRRIAQGLMGLAVYESLRGRHGAAVDSLLDQLIIRSRRGLAVATGVEAVRTGNRRGCLAAARDPFTPARFRPKFALAAIAPRLASRFL